MANATSLYEVLMIACPCLQLRHLHRLIDHGAGSPTRTIGRLGLEFVIRHVSHEVRNRFVLRRSVVC